MECLHDKMLAQRQVYTQFYRGRSYGLNDLMSAAKARIVRHPEQITSSIPKKFCGIQVLAKRLRELVNSDNFDDFVLASYCSHGPNCKRFVTIDAAKLPFTAVSCCGNANVRSCLCGCAAKHFSYLLHVPSNTLVIIGTDCKYRFVQKYWRRCTRCGTETGNYTKVCDDCQGIGLQRCAVPGCARDCYRLKKKADFLEWDPVLSQRIVCRFHRSPVGVAEICESRKCDGCERPVAFGKSIYNRLCVGCDRPFQICEDHAGYVRCKECS